MVFCPAPNRLNPASGLLQTPSLSQTAVESDGESVLPSLGEAAVSLVHSPGERDDGTGYDGNEDMHGFSNDPCKPAPGLQGRPMIHIGKFRVFTR